MDLHANAVLTVRQRQRVCDLVATGVTITAAALVVGCSRQTASKWVNRRRRGESLRDRSSRPHHSPRRTPAVVEQAILRARLELREGPHVIGWALGVAASTVHAVLRRHGRSRLRVKAPSEEVVRYERASPGELVHVDVKKLGRILRPGHRVTGDRRGQAKGRAGWQHLFDAIDDHSRRVRRRLPRRDCRQRAFLPRRDRSLLRRSQHVPRTRAHRRMKVKWRSAASFAIVSLGAGD